MTTNGIWSKLGFGEKRENPHGVGKGVASRRILTSVHSFSVFDRRPGHHYHHQSTPRRTLPSFVDGWMEGWPYGGSTIFALCSFFNDPATLSFALCWALRYTTACHYSNPPRRRKKEKEKIHTTMLFVYYWRGICERSAIG